MAASLIFGIVSIVMFIAVAAYKPGKSVFDCKESQSS